MDLRNRLEALLERKFLFGKHIRSKYRHVFENDPNYIDWVVNYGGPCKCFDEIRYIAEYWNTETNDLDDDIIATTRLTRDCSICGAALRPILNDWVTRDCHKKCWKEHLLLMDPDYIRGIRLSIREEEQRKIQDEKLVK